MGIVSRIANRRHQRKVEVKAAQAAARAQVKADARLELKKEKYLSSTAKRVLKENAREARTVHQADKQLAKALVARSVGRGPKVALQWVGVVRKVMPLLIPLGYKALAAAQKRKYGS